METKMINYQIIWLKKFKNIIKEMLIKNRNKNKAKKKMIKIRFNKKLKLDYN